MRRESDRQKRIIWIVLIIAAIAAVIALLIPRPTEVETAEAFRGDLVLDLSTTGVVEGNVADVSARVVGEVSEILVEEGDAVRQGQTVALLDPSELQADVDRARAALATAQAQLAAANQGLAGETRQVNAEISRARAAVSAARSRLAELQAGSRPQEIRQAQAAVDQAAAQARNAQLELNRAEQLYQEGAISRRQLDEARTAVQVAEANLSAARERLALVREGARSEQIEAAQAEVRAAEATLAQALAGEELIAVRQEEVRAARAQVEQAQAVLQAAQARLGFTSITSPITGTVVRRHVEEGETVSPQQPIVTVARDGDIWVTAEVDQEDVAAVDTGQQVRISLDAYPGRYATGVVTDVSPVAVPKEVGRVRAKVVRARIDIVESDLPLRAGMEVNVDGSLKVAEDVLLVPNDAVQRVGDKDVVYVIRDGRAYRQEVEVGLSNFDYTIIRDGLSAGQVVAVSNVDDLTDGERVRTVK